MKETEGIKYTNQRVEILNFLQGNLTHPTVDEVYEEVKKKLTRISKATVYQNLSIGVRSRLNEDIYGPSLQNFAAALHIG